MREKLLGLFAGTAERRKRGAGKGKVKLLIVEQGLGKAALSTPSLPSLFRGLLFTLLISEMPEGLHMLFFPPQ